MGPVILAVTSTLLNAWINEKPVPPGVQGVDDPAHVKGEI
jgi:hypothetical protein